MTLEEILQQSELDRMLSGNVRPYQNHAFSEYKPTFQEKSYDFINKYVSTPAAKSLVGNKGNFGLMDLTGVGSAAEQIARNTGRGINQGNYGDVALGFGLLGLDVTPAGKIVKPIARGVRNKVDGLLTGDAWKKANILPENLRKARNPETTKAVEDLVAGKINNFEYKNIVEKTMPVKPIQKVPNLITVNDVKQNILYTGGASKAEKGILELNKNIKTGTRVSVRIDVPSFNATGNYVTSFHDGSIRQGKILAYGRAAHIKNNLKFHTNPKAALSVARGSSKVPIARVHGDMLNTKPEKIKQLAEKYINDPEWTQVGMNPERFSYFYNRKTMQPVIGGEEMVQVGDLVLVKNAKFTTLDDIAFEYINKETGVKGLF